MKVKNREVNKIMRILEDVRITIDDAMPLVGRRQLLLERAYDSILMVEDVFKRG